jgi:CDP-4-dehydro-6-deoxyglucose reductase
MAKPISDELTIEWGTEDAGPSSFRPANALFVVTDKRRRRARGRAAPAPGRPADPLLARPVRDPRQPARRHPARAYSISNAPRPDGELVLQVARADGGVTSNWIHDSLAIGESVKLSGAYGTFIGDPGVDTPVLCLAAGTGLAPSWPSPKPPCGAASASRSPCSSRPAAKPTSTAGHDGLVAHQAPQLRLQDHPDPRKADGCLAGRVDAVLPGSSPTCRSTPSLPPAARLLWTAAWPP